MYPPYRLQWNWLSFRSCRRQNSRIDTPLRAAARIALRQYLSFSTSRFPQAIASLRFSPHTSAQTPRPVPLPRSIRRGGYREENGFTGRLRQTQLLQSDGSQKDGSRWVERSRASLQRQTRSFRPQDTWI